jgi:hypothetical protein
MIILPVSEKEKRADILLFQAFPVQFSQKDQDLLPK